jgi:hypothetical protein
LAEPERPDLAPFMLSPLVNGTCADVLLGQSRAWQGFETDATVFEEKRLCPDSC